MKETFCMPFNTQDSLAVDLNLFILYLRSMGFKCYPNDTTNVIRQDNIPQFINLCKINKIPYYYLSDEPNFKVNLPFTIHNVIDIKSTYNL